ncbi:MAG: polyprenyl synthetase family protein [Burkholderiales bacterium]|jgi:farnesyl diphosphate synthase|nr:polyprenyl synthetase family protein [Burkholderiales bacterium]
MRACQARVERVLDALLPAHGAAPASLRDGMRYAVLGGGKRLRALLAYAAAECTQVPTRGADAIAAAVELIHAYSLVHDDMPCMDDDAMRRGKPTVHVQFGEATALLVGDTLQCFAFEVLTADATLDPARCAQMVLALARASGADGMAGGQAIDLASLGGPLDLPALERMHRMKTGALITASVALPGVLAGADADTRTTLDTYAAHVGLAFQVVDDVLDATADQATLGKTPGKDAQNAKPTYASELGIDAATRFAFDLRDRALAALAPLGPRAARLADLARFVVARPS